MLGALPGETRVTARPLAGARFLVLLSPLLVGTLVALIRRDISAPGTPVFVAWALLYTALLLLASYASVLVYNGVRVALRKATTVKAWVLLSPLIIGMVFTLVMGLVGRSGPYSTVPIPLPYYTIGFPLPWYRFSIQNCVVSQFAGGQCTAVFSVHSFMLDALVFVGLYLLIFYFSTLVNNAVPIFKKMKWPFFLPRFHVRDGATTAGPMQ